MMLVLARSTRLNNNNEWCMRNITVYRNRVEVRDVTKIEITLYPFTRRSASLDVDWNLRTLISQKYIF